jgi:hypothetical protein
VATHLYCSRGDVNDWIPSGELVGKSDLLASALATSDVLTLDGHGLEDDDPVKVSAIEGGSVAAPLVSGTVYYAIRVNNAEFQLAATAGGSAIDLSSDGDGMRISREPKYDNVIEFWSRWADGFLPAHAVPLDEPIPPLVRVITAKLSAYDLMGIEGKDSARAAKAQTDAKEALQRLQIGIPIPGATEQRSTNLAVVASSTSLDRRGWGRDRIP